MPPFIFRDKSLRFPKLPPNQTQENDDVKYLNTPGQRGKYQGKKNNNSFEEKKSNKYRDDQLEDDINFEDFQIPMKINKKVHLQPIRNSANNMNLNSAGNDRSERNHENHLKNAKNTKRNYL